MPGGGRQLAPQLLDEGVWIVGAAVAAAAMGSLATNTSVLRLVVAVGLLFLVVMVGVRSPRPLLLALPVWLGALGLVRRLLTGISSGGSADPLLLVGPLALIVLAVAALDRGAARRPTPLSKLVLAYTALVVMGAVNPLQPSLKAGVTALIFFVPLVAFWIGRGLLDRVLLRRVLLVIGVLGVPAALYGLLQTFSGFPSWDERWITAQSYSAINVGGVIRPFSTFSNAAEYAAFLAVAMIVWLRLGPRRWLRPIAVAMVALLAVAAFFESSRSPIVMLLAGGAVMFAAWRRLPLGAAAVLGAVLLFALPAVASHFAGGSGASTSSDSTSASLVQHQVQGLANPFDPSASTAGAHLHLMVVGVESAFHEPIGQGISTVTVAAAKYGGTNSSTEADPSNAAVALGLPGLLVFLSLFAVGFGSAYRLARSGDRLAGAALGILTVTTLQWLNGGQYSVAFLPWLLLGWVDRELHGLDEPAAVAAPEAAQTAVAALEPPRRPVPPSPLPLPAPASAPPAAEPETSPEPARRWNVEQLERLPGLDQEQRFLLLFLRGHASAQGMLADVFDPLVRSAFGPLLAHYDGES